MFRRVLIANRGEIACRIIATCRRMGVESVAVFSEADRGALHVALADAAVAIGGPAPAESYLRGDAIIAAAQAAGAAAIHPGYGFLSENPAFAEAVEAAGLVWIGPPAAAIRAMGLKDAAKRLMEAAGVPVVPGWHGESQAAGHLLGAAEAIGFPVVIKAVAGGGGKGMRRLEGPAGFAEALASAQAEARAAFGDDRVLIEKWIDRPRHIEVQVFGDGTDAVHLYERDCSLQRRHQKVIEEAPAPGMTAEMRAAMGAAAVRAARAIGYRGAGTVEFIVDAGRGLRPDGFWFMEMNTRLQVEHPVTEAITGIDLVEWQLRVASGEPLPLRQEEIPLSGHAVEARLYAEDVAAGFLPATGRIAHLAFPPGVRADSGVRSGDAISPWYDPMIAKIIAHGPTRAVALARLARGLEATEVAGTVTNLAFLCRLARHPGLLAGEVDTGLIGRDIAALAAAPAADDALGRAVAATALLAAADLPAGPLAGFALWAPLRHPVVLDEGRLAGVVAPEGPDAAQVETGGSCSRARRGPQGWSVEGMAPLPVVRAHGAIHVFAPDGRGAASFRLHDPLARAAAHAADDGIARSPLPGRVRAVAVAAGEAVAPGARLAVIESMKMEHAVTAAAAGRVAEVLVAVGAQVEAGTPLVRIEAGP